jgi:hypothetical protein
VGRSPAINGTPTNSMVLYVSWQNIDSSTETDCENLNNASTVGNLVRVRNRLLSHPTPMGAVSAAMVRSNGTFRVNLVIYHSLGA